MRDAEPGPADANADASSPDPISTEEALERLDDGEFVAVVREFWERRGWSVVEVRESDAWYVDLTLRRDWATEQRGLLRVERTASAHQISGAEIRQFVREVQRTDVDWGTMVSATDVSDSTRQVAAESNVGLVDGPDLVRSLNQWGAHDLLAHRVGRTVVAETEPLVARAPEPLDRVLERFDVVESVGGFVDRYLPPNPSATDLARVTFSGLRVLLMVSAVTFLLALIATGGSVLSWLLMGVFLFVTYVGLLPVMVADVYLVRQFAETSWTPTWWSLVAFAFAPLLFVVVGVYWYRRRHRTESGQNAAWFDSTGGVFSRLWR